MAKRVRAIPATLNMFNSSPVMSKEKRRVAAYARVSTDTQEQQTSYDNQVNYYTSYINGRDDWELVKIYTDEGISALNTKKRDGFKQMVKDALDGKIDLIITKSISRFARNTVDSLTTVRELKEKGVEIYFEKENIWTFDSKGELLITIMSSLAQEESRSISENTTWGVRKRFEEGKVSIAFSKFLGYDEGFVINEEEAKIVRLIYKLFLRGNNMGSICSELERRGIKTPLGLDKWCLSTVKSILTNEKYKGDALLQKEYMADYLQKKRKKNHGEVPQYYVEEHHDPIIEPVIFDMVQIELEKAQKYGRNVPTNDNIFVPKLRCGDCGTWYCRVIHHSNEPKKRKIAYRCRHKYEGEKCTSPTVMEDKVKEKFTEVMDSMVDAKKETLKNIDRLIKKASDVSMLEEREKAIEEELKIMESQLKSLIAENAKDAIDQDVYEKRYREEFALYEQKMAERDRVAEEKTDRRIRAEMLKRHGDTLKKLRKRDTGEFNEDLWCELLDSVVAVKGGKLIFNFRGGISIETSLN